ncbi:MFS transporter [Rhodococcus sp. ACS1]|uniref:MFS transporter, MHS family, shikimate and dehydroshikimate transport protein n=1 Tax=Rhodococcus koreensis TaxID=99653 RepID=A0A1H4Y7N3_9NOCA|nr:MULTISPECIES: MFS transporter [Rhodococcus]PBC48578.1 MFS transporter [Rhodococcus sp. ACS1]QSE79931.1 MHS family MFS transporter [Rhodococcus koreensis]SED13857.1 MFS transporter, MHS family, shikimate and dehydroshikimate transport protein [Rhodococcus koreensis]
MGMTELGTERSTAVPHGSAGQQRRRVIKASAAGTVIEWYDFTLYGLAAALVFGPLYFPGAGSLAGTMAAFGTFAVGLGARPIGGLVFAHFGDRIGRKPMLLMTLLVMGASTTLIGALPTADAIGIWAPILLIVLRLFQGAGAGAEFAGAITMVTESTDSSRRALSSAYPGAAIYVGTGGATAIFALLTLMPDDLFLSWGWRIPFLASAVIVLVAGYLRLKVNETAVFEEAAQHGEVDRAPLVEAVRNHWRQILCGLALFSFVIPWAYVMQVFALSFVTKTLGVDSTQALIGLIVAEFCAIPVILGFGRLADRIGRKPVLLSGAVFGIVFPFPMFMMLDTRSPWMVGLALILGICLVQGTTSGPGGALLSELFPTKIRWSGIAISREIPAAVVGGTIPLVATALVAVAGGTPWLVASYLMGLSVVGLIGIALLPETLGRSVGARTHVEAAS